MIPFDNDNCRICGNNARITHLDALDTFISINCDKCGNILISDDKYTKSQIKIIMERIKTVRKIRNNTDEFIIIHERPIGNQLFSKYDIIASIGAYSMVIKDDF